MGGTESTARHSQTRGPGASSLDRCWGPGRTSSRSRIAPGRVGRGRGDGNGPREGGAGPAALPLGVGLRADAPVPPLSRAGPPAPGQAPPPPPRSGISGHGPPQAPPPPEASG